MPDTNPTSSASPEWQWREWIHEQPDLSRCGVGADTCPDWPLAHRLADQAAKIAARAAIPGPDSERIRELEAENRRLRKQLDEASLRSIEARNPGIDMDEVRRMRARR